MREYSRRMNDPKPPAPGPGFCKNIALGASTPLLTLFGKAQAGTPDPNSDFEPDTLKITEGTTVRVVDQGGEPHTFTEVAHFGGGFLPPLNAPGEETVAECSGGFSNIAVARTRILQGSSSDITGLAKGEHLFQCCIHPWMRVKVGLVVVRRRSLIEREPSRGRSVMPRTGSALLSSARRNSKHRVISDTIRTPSCKPK